MAPFLWYQERDQSPKERGWMSQQLKWLGCQSGGDRRKGQVSEGPTLPWRHKGVMPEAIRTQGHDEIIHVQKV